MLEVAVSLLPVLLFLAALVFLDSYKLVRLRTVITTIVTGCVVAAVAMLITMWLLNNSTVSPTTYKRYGSPILEEFLKASYVVYLIRARKVGFMVDAAILGFSVGAGFACVENIYYLRSISDANIFLWIVRGFGTAVMHGGTTAIFAVVSKNITDAKSSVALHFFLAGLGIAFTIHSFFNHFFLPPIILTVSVLITLPSIMTIVFRQSEKGTREWLGVGFDTDADLLKMIITGNVSRTKIGAYLEALQSKFLGEVLADMLCYLRLYLELAVQAKGILLMREAGFDAPPDPEVQEKFAEMKYLEKSIGRTGRLALDPLLHVSNRDLWQLHMLGKK